MDVLYADMIVEIPCKIILRIKVDGSVHLLYKIWQDPTFTEHGEIKCT